MKTYTYFEQEGSKFKLIQNNKSTIVRIVLCTAIAIGSYFFFPPSTNLNLFLAVLFLVFALVNLIKITKKLTIDTAARTVTDKTNFLSTEVVYRFNEFIRFSMETHSTNFVKTNHLAAMIFEKNNKEKSVTLLTSAFGGAPTQNIINEASEIMGIEM